ncbi:hypothetical protein, partial [Salmonella enterica]|uniref:hypothetical protein n=1 Tax=Salmonella enterica TaxID=28901 RepID=UPI003D2E545F
FLEKFRGSGGCFEDAAESLLIQVSNNPQAAFFGSPSQLRRNSAGKGSRHATAPSMTSRRRVGEARDRR